MLSESDYNPIDYRNKYLVVEKICHYGYGDTFRFFFHCKRSGRLMTALVLGNGAEVKVGNKVYYRDIKTVELAGESGERQFNASNSRSAVSSPVFRRKSSVNVGALLDNVEDDDVIYPDRGQDACGVRTSGSE